MSGRLLYQSEQSAPIRGMQGNNGLSAKTLKNFPKSPIHAAMAVLTF